MWLSNERKNKYINNMKQSNKSGREIVLEQRNRLSSLLNELSNLVELKERELEENKLKKITKDQLDYIKTDILYLNNILNNNKAIDENYYLQSFALVFRCSDWNYNGKEEKELFDKLAEMDDAIKMIQFFTYELNSKEKLEFKIERFLSKLKK